MPVRARTVGIVSAWAASLALVFVLTRPGSVAAPPPSASERTVVIDRPGADRIVPAGGGITAAEIRAAVRAELPASATSGDAAVDDREPSPVRDDDAFHRADADLVAAMSDGRWTDADREAFRGSLASLDQDQRESLLQALVPAINAGELTVETSGTAF